MHWIDWSIVGIFTLALFGIAFFSKKYTRSVADFLSANRCAGRYLLTVAQASVGIGTMFVIANFEKYYHSGMAIAWWGYMIGPLYMIMAIAGWIIYRYRETRAMTLAQFFEIRYSRNFRIFTGILSWVAGVIAYGIVPAVTARFFHLFLQNSSALLFFGAIANKSDFGGGYVCYSGNGCIFCTDWWADCGYDN